jgi:hypothetical protein
LRSRRAISAPRKKGIFYLIYLRYAENNSIGFFDMAFRYMIADRPDKAMDWIEKGFELHDPLMTYITRSARILEPLFGDPQFIAVYGKMKLPLPE